MSELPRGFEGGRNSRSVAIRAGAAICIPGINDDAAHLRARFLKVSLRDEHRRGLHAIRREDGGCRCGCFAHQKPEIESGLLDAAGRRGERKAARKVRFFRAGVHAAETGIAESLRTDSAARSAITVAMTATSLHDRCFGHARQSRSIFSVSDRREPAANPWRTKNSGGWVTAKTRDIPRHRLVE